MGDLPPTHESSLSPSRSGATRPTMDEDADVMPHIAQTDEGLVRHDRAPANRPRVPSLTVALTAETTVADHGAIGLDHGGRRSAEGVVPVVNSDGGPEPTQTGLAQQCRMGRSLVPLFVLFGLYALAPGFLGPMIPEIIKTPLHESMCPNITAATNSSLSSANTGYRLKAEKDSLNGVLSFVGAVVFGSVADKMRRKSVILLGLIGTCMPYLALAVTCDNAYFIPLASLSGASESALSIGIAAYIADLVPSQDRAPIYGISFICPVVVLAAVAPLGAMYAQAYKETAMQSIFLVASVLSVTPVLAFHISFVLALFLFSFLLPCL